MKFVTNLIEAHIFRHTDGGIEFLMLKRAENEIFPGLWQMVSGKIKDGEKAYETALREIREETGLRPIKFWSAPNINSFYDADKDNITFLPVFAALIGTSDDVKLSKEHTAFKWVKTGEAKKLLAWPGQRKSVDVIENYFNKEINFLNFVEIEI